MHDERLSESVKSLSNSLNNQNQTQDMSINDTSSNNDIESKIKIIDDSQNLYEKKALEYSGIAGTNTVYRDY